MTPINLLPAPRQRALRCRRHLRAWLVAFGVMLLGLGCAAAAARVLLRDRGGELVTEVANSRSRLAQTQSAIEGFQKEQASIKSRRHAMSVLTDQPQWSAFLRLLGDRLGSDLVLRDMKIQQVAAPGGPPVAQRAASRLYRLDLRGLAKGQSSVSRYVSALEETLLFDEVRLLRTAREGFLSGTATSFEITCRLHDIGGN